MQDGMTMPVGTAESQGDPEAVARRAAVDAIVRLGMAEKLDELPTGNNRKARRHYAALLRRSPQSGTSGVRAFAKRVSKRRAKKGYR